jgi:hypothetical protein
MTARSTQLALLSAALLAAAAGAHGGHKHKLGRHAAGQRHSHGYGHADDERGAALGSTRGHGKHGGGVGKAGLSPWPLEGAVSTASDNAAATPLLQPTGKAAPPAARCLHPASCCPHARAHAPPPASLLHPCCR